MPVPPTLEDGTLEGSSENYDFVISTDGTSVVLDVFATNMQDNDDAHVESSYSNRLKMPNSRPKDTAARAAQQSGNS
jgi:hypothetical protein